MKNNIAKFFITAFFLCFTLVTFAQPGTEDNGGLGNLEDEDTGAPIDGYLWVLLAIGLVFAFTKFRAVYLQRIAANNK